MGILHHEVEALFRIRGIKGLIGTASLQHTERGDGHPLAAGYEDRDDVFQTETSGSDVGCYAVAQLVYLFISIALVSIDNGDVVGRFLRLTAEQRHDGLRVVVRHIVLVEAVERRQLRGGGYLHVAKKLVIEESLHHSLVALEILADERLRIFVAVVFRLDMILSVLDKCLDIERSLKGAVAQTDGLHRLAAQLLVGKEHTVPGKHRVGLQSEVVHHVAEGVGLVAAHTAHLLLSGFQKVEDGRRVVKLAIDGQRLHRHAHRMEEALVGASVVDGGEERLLFVVILGQQETVGCGEKVAPEDAVLLAETVYAGHIDAECAHLRCLAVDGFFEVGHQLCETVVAVEVPGIPLLALLESCRPTQFGFFHRQFGQRHSFGL